MDPSLLFLLPLFLHRRSWGLALLLPCHIRDNGRFYKHSSIQTLCSQCCLVKYRKSPVRRLLYSTIRLIHTYLYMYLFGVQEGNIFNMFLPNIFLKYFHEVEKTIPSKLKVKWARAGPDNYVSKNWTVRNTSLIVPLLGKDGRIISIIII